MKIGPYICITKPGRSPGFEMQICGPNFISSYTLLFARMMLFSIGFSSYQGQSNLEYISVLSLNSCTLLNSIFDNGNPVTRYFQSSRPELPLAFALAGCAAALAGHAAAIEAHAP